MPFNLLFSSPVFRGLLAAGLIAGACAWGYLAIRSSGVAACERNHLAADAAAQAAEHQQYLAALAWGEQISNELSKTQRRLDATKAEYLTYANAITGNCPAALGLLADSAARGVPVPKPSSAPTDAAIAVSAAALGANIAENYARCHLNAEQLAALIAWHNRPKEAVTQ